VEEVAGKSGARQVPARVGEKAAANNAVSIAFDIRSKANCD